MTTAVGLVAPGLAGAAVSAPADIISFPARDFVSATGYKLSDLYTVEVQHPDGRVVGTVTDVAPKDDGEGGGLGIIEVNHPGVVLPSTESTIFENGAAAIAGPSAPCTAPLEKLPPPPGSETTPPSDAAGLNGSASNTTVTLNWNAATGNVDVTDYGIYRTDATGVTTAIATVQNPDGSNNPPTTFTDQNVAPGTYTYTVDAGDAVGNGSVNMSNAVTVTTPVNPAVPATAPAPTGTRGLIGFPQRDFISATGYTLVARAQPSLM